MDRANSHTKSYNILRSFEAMYINIKYELRARVTCAMDSNNLLYFCEIVAKTKQRTFSNMDFNHFGNKLHFFKIIIKFIQSVILIEPSLFQFYL